MLIYFKKGGFFPCFAFPSTMMTYCYWMDRSILSIKFSFFNLALALQDDLSKFLGLFWKCTNCSCKSSSNKWLWKKFLKRSLSYESSNMQVIYLLFWTSWISLHTQWGIFIKHYTFFPPGKILIQFWHCCIFQKDNDFSTTIRITYSSFG